MSRSVRSGPLTLTLSLADEVLPQGGTISGEILVEVVGDEPFHFRSLFLDFDGVESNSVKDDQGEFDAFLDDFTSTRSYLHRRATPAGVRDAAREDAEAAEQLRQELLFREHHAAPYAGVVPWREPKRAKSTAQKKPQSTPTPPAAGPTNPSSPQSAQAGASTSGFSPREGSDAPCEPVGAESSRTDPPRGVRALHGVEAGAYGDVVKDRFLPGRYRFPFNFTIPPWMPPSLYYRAGHTAYGEIRYGVTVSLTVPGPAPDVRLHAPFVVLSTLSKRQLLRARREAVDTATINPLPPLSAQFQVFGCELWGSFCCLDTDGAVEVEVALQCSRALLLTDPRGLVDQALEGERAAGGDDVARTVTRGYDAFAQRRPPGAGVAHVQPSAEDGAASVYDGIAEARQRVLKALPAPVGTLPLVVRVDNRCAGREISRVRVELREVIRFFKALEPPHILSHPISRFDYTVSIPPRHEATFPVPLELPRQFRRTRQDPDTLLPPPGVRTANFCTQTLIVVSFPDLHVYTQEEDWTVGAVHLAEALDLTDSVLELPVAYS